MLKIKGAKAKFKIFTDRGARLAVRENNNANGLFG